MRHFVPVLSFSVALLCSAGAYAVTSPSTPGAASATVVAELKAGKSVNAVVATLKAQGLDVAQIAAALLDAGVPASSALSALLAAGFKQDESATALIAAGADPASVLPATAAGPTSGDTAAGLNANTSPAPALTTPSFSGGGGSVASRS